MYNHAKSSNQKSARRERVLQMIRAGIIGATGYAGGELVRLLTGHKEAKVVWFGSRNYQDVPYTNVYQNLFQIIDGSCGEKEMEALAEETDVIFTATPQGFCAGAVSEAVLKKTKVIDLSADFRLKEVETYEKWYQIEQKSPELLKGAVYGLCEWNREKIASARLIANPGCYPTCSLMAILPLIKNGLIDPDTLIIDAKSGTSGAGRTEKIDNLYCEVNENMKAYGVTTHRHTPEIEERISLVAEKKVCVNFTPHLVPMNRGILVTAYASLMPHVTEQNVREAYDSCYGKEKFVRVLRSGVCPQTKWVEGSNYVDVGFQIDERTRRIVIMGAMDNLVKGAAGQAVQNMNLMFGLDEAEGLTAIPMFP